MNSEDSEIIEGEHLEVIEASHEVVETISRELLLSYHEAFELLKDK